jgi:hypothetical protein
MTGFASAAQMVISSRAATLPRRVSGMQLEVLGLYRSILRAARLKDPLGSNGPTYDVAKQQFREQVRSFRASRSCLFSTCNFLSGYFGQEIGFPKNRVHGAQREQAAEAAPGSQR